MVYIYYIYIKINYNYYQMNHLYSLLYTIKQVHTFPLPWNKENEENLLYDGKYIDSLLKNIISN